MKYIFIFVVLTTVSASNSISLFEKIFDGKVTYLEFDSSFNKTYILNSTETGFNYIVLDSSKNIIFQQTMMYVSKMILNAKDELYFVYQNDSYNSGSTYTVGVWNSIVIPIFQLFSVGMSGVDIILFSDEESNLIFNSEKGVMIRKAGTSNPVLIENLKNFAISKDSVYATDKEGNIYLGVTSFTSSSKMDPIYMIRRDEKKLQTPVARVMNGIVNDEGKAADISADPKTGYVYFGGENFVKAKIGDDIHTFDNKLGEVNDFFHFVNDLVFYGKLEGKYNDTCSIMCKGCFRYDRFENILSVRAARKCDYIQVSDSQGNTFFGFGHSIYDETVLYSWRNEANKIIKINIPNYLPLRDMLVDENDDLWILAGDLYYVRNGTYVAKIIPGLPYSEDFAKMKINKVTNEIYIGTGKGLYTVIKPKNPIVKNDLR